MVSDAAVKSGLRGQGRGQRASERLHQLVHTRGSGRALVAAHAPQSQQVGMRGHRGANECRGSGGAGGAVTPRLMKVCGSRSGRGAAHAHGGCNSRLKCCAGSHTRVPRGSPDAAGGGGRKRDCASRAARAGRRTCAAPTPLVETGSAAHFQVGPAAGAKNPGRPKRRRASRRTSAARRARTCMVVAAANTAATVSNFITARGGA